MGTLLEIVYNKMTIEQLEYMNNKGVSFNINDGLIVSANNENIPIKPASNRQGWKHTNMLFLCHFNIEERNKSNEQN